MANPSWPTNRPPPPARSTFRAESGEVDDATWGRAGGWALVRGVVFLAYSNDTPAFHALGRRTIAAVLADRLQLVPE